MPGLPQGKPAGVPCPHLDAELRCRLFGQPERPAVCGSLPPSHEMCGESREQAMVYLQRLEAATCPGPGLTPGRQVAAAAPNLHRGHRS